MAVSPTAPDIFSQASSAVHDRERSPLSYARRVRKPPPPVVINPGTQEQKAILLFLPNHRRAPALCHSLYPIPYHSFRDIRKCSQRPKLIVEVSQLLGISDG